MHPLSDEDLLRWYLEAGVDEAIGESAVDRYAIPAVSSQASSAVGSGSVPLFPTLSAEAAVEKEARLRATAAQTLEELRSVMENFEGFPLKETARHTVFAAGIPDADVMIVGEAPGADEDASGEPFVGVSGQLLDRILKSIGLDRTKNVYISNVLSWRPPGNRRPTPQEVAVCLPFIARHIELAAPKLLVLFGGAAASALLAQPVPIGQLRGRWHAYSAKNIPTLATYHPAFLLRTPSHKREVWKDMLEVKRKLEEIL